MLAAFSKSVVFRTKIPSIMSHGRPQRGAKRAFAHTWKLELRSKNF